jgi:cell division protease FtsH
MDGFNNDDLPVFVLGATNYPDRLDAALLRPGRFDEVITLDRPNFQARQELLSMLSGNLKTCQGAQIMRNM